MAIDPKAMQAKIIAGLPLRARWMINETPLDYDFSIAHQGLRAPTADLLESG
jgi:hypothetical protein